MRITYIRLENVAGLSVGSNRKELEISFEKSKNKIIAIQGMNGVGKSVLLASLTPFSSVTSLDERSSLSYIIPKKSGYKEIHYQDGDDQYIIKHYYKPIKEDSHSVKSYFNMNGNELNENGNVTSFNELVEMHFGLTQEMMRLMRLGTNVGSFISLTPARRKEYIGRLISEIDIYLQIYKKTNEDIKVVKTLLSSNNSSLYNCHISDIVVEEERLSSLYKEIKSYEKDRDKLISKISKINALMADNDINELKRKKQEAESSLREFDKVESEVKSLSLQHTTIDQLMKKRSNLSDKRIDIQSKINSYRISIDSTLKSIERLELNIKKITSNNDVQSLVDAIESLKSRLKSVSKSIVEFHPLCTSDEMYEIVNKLSSFNQIGQMIHTLGNKPLEVYLKLKRSGKSVDKFLKEQMKNNLSRLNESDLRSLLSQLFQDDMIISPNCDTEYTGCPYYRFADTITAIRDKIEDESFDDETLRYIQVISNNIDNILNGIDSMAHIQIPDSLKDELREKIILDRLSSRSLLFDLSKFQEYLGIVKEYELYKQDREKLSEYEHQLSIYKKSGVDSHLSEIKQLQDSISFYKSNISTLEASIIQISKDLDDVDSQVGLVTKFNDSKKYRNIFESTLESTNKILGPLESASKEKMELEFSLRNITNSINRSRESHRELEMKINEYKRLVEEGEKLSTKYRDLNIILKSASTKGGIPVIYINRYLGKIKKLANKLLKIIYDDDLRLGKFQVDEDTFEIPFIKNGFKIPDIKYGSQSELPLMTIALSFALANNASNLYNILMLDEVDAGLDEDNRQAFLNMLHTQICNLNAEQVFIISHNLSQMINIPMDCIRLSDINIDSKLQNVIYSV